jgi:hypothetical protein
MVIVSSLATVKSESTEEGEAIAANSSSNNKNKTVDHSSVQISPCDEYVKTTQTTPNCDS